MMRTTVTVLLCLLLGSSYAQIDLSPEEWREDLRFLQKTIQEDYPFLFKKTTPADFAAAVEELHEAIPRMADHEVVVGFARLVSSFGYGHTNIWVSGWDPENPYGFHQMPYNLYYFSDGIYVQGVHQDYEPALGAKLLKVAGVPVEEALAAIRPVVPVENEQFFKAFGLTYLGTPEVLHAQGVTAELQETITLTLEKDGRVFEQTFAPVAREGYPGQYSQFHEDGEWLDARDNSVTPLWLKNLDRIYFYEYLPEQKAVYVRHSQIQDDPEQRIPDFYAEVFDFIENNEVERFILDVRLNGGGNNYKNKPIITGVLGCDKINESGKFYVILGRRTFSACQNLVNDLDTYTPAIFVGEPTAENINFYGDNRPVELPNSKINARLSFAWWQDKPQWENDDWLAPNLAADLSFADYQKNVDPALEAIWNFDADTPIVDPMEYLTELFTAGRIDEITPAAKRMVADPLYQYYPFEDRLNRAGYQLMDSKQIEPAFFVFNLVTELFPESPNAWNSLAEVHWRTGQVEPAIALYEKVIAMDPDGPTGENARAMLAEIRKGKE